jgi:hypothetical protein
MIAGLAKPQRGKMPACDIVDMHEIEPGIDKTRNAARCRFDDDPACRRRFLVARPNRRRRTHDDGRQMLAIDHRFDDPLGGNLALFIGPDRTRFTQPHRLVGLPAIRRASDGSPRCLYRRRAPPPPGAPLA